MIADRIAKRYAKSVFDLSIEKNQLEAVYQDILALKNIFENSKDFKVFLKSPVIQTMKKLAILKSLFSKDLNFITMTFVELVCRHRRENYLEFVVAEFIKLYNTNQNITIVELTSAVTLTDADKSQIMALVAKEFVTTVTVVEKINKALIGGFIVKIGDKRFDGSVATALRKLDNNFKQNLYINQLFED